MLKAVKGDPTRIFHKVVVLVSLFIIIITTVYGVTMSILNGVEVVGQTFIDVEFPPIHVFPLFYMKPITWLNLAILLMAYSLLELNKERISQFSRFKFHFLKFGAFLVAALALYEVLFNFTLWSGLIAADSILGKLNPDVIINPFPNPKLPWNIVFATKLYLAATIVGLYMFFFLTRIETALSKTNV